jgi:hypothetical protein
MRPVRRACWWYLFTTCEYKPIVADVSGNLRVETDGVSTTNVHMTNSYLVGVRLSTWLILA